MNKLLIAGLALAALAPCLPAVETETWIQSQHEEFEKGKLKKLSLRSDGHLSLAPEFKELYDTSSAYMWALAEDSKGRIYAGGGGPGGETCKIWMLTPDGKSKELASVEGLEIHSIVVDRKDRIYAATSPDGKVYRINKDGKAEVFYDPKEKYIWGMVFDSKGNLYVATGDTGQIHRISPDGKGSVFFKTEETHARSIAVDAADNVIVGTEPGGLILRVSPAAEGFILYEAPKKEITAVAVSKDGAIYAAAAGTKQLGAPLPTFQPPAAAAPSGVPSAGTPGGQAPAATPTRATPPSLIRLPGGGSDVYRIGTDGFPAKIWSHPQDIVYTLAFDGKGLPVVGTGNEGSIYRIDSQRLFTLVVSAPPNQVTALLTAKNGAMYAATGNVGKIFRLGPEQEKEGTIESDVFDSGLFSHWGRLTFRGKKNGGGIAVAVRSGNVDRPQQNWSPWSEPITTFDGGRASVPASRFAQWKATLTTSGDGQSPQLESVQLAYIARNVAPVVTQIEITPPNYQFPQQMLRANPSETITLPPLGQKPPSKPKSSAGIGSSQSMKKAKGYIGARWLASDENEDSLIYEVEIRGIAETAWKRLAEKLEDSHYSWDSTAFPDGYYVLHVTASDSPDNPPAQARSATLESEAFLIDNTPPTISGLAAQVVAEKATALWQAKDASSVIDSAEYSLDGGEWTAVEPTTGLSDSPELDYKLELKNLSPGEHTIAVRATDEFDNQAVAKTVVTVPAK